MTIREQEPRNMTVRELTIRADSLDKDARTVEAVFATEDVVSAFSLERWEPVNEVLLMRGMEPFESITLLDSHPQKHFMGVTTEDVRGKGSEVSIRNGELVGTLTFDTDEASENVFRKVTGGFVRNVSIGIEPLETTVIEPGQSQTVMGRRFSVREGDPTLFVRTKWQAREISTVVWGADPRAQIREETNDTFARNRKMNEALRQYLLTLGMDKDISVRGAWEYYANLTGQEKTSAVLLLEPGEEQTAREGTESTTTTTTTTAVDEAALRESIRQDILGSVTTALGGDGASEGGQATASDEAIRQQERTRYNDMVQLFGEDREGNGPLFDQCIREGFTVDQARERLLQVVRNARTPAVDGRGPAIHSRSHEGDCTAQTLAAALMVRTGTRLDHSAYTTQQAYGMGLHQRAPWLVRSVNDDVRQQTMERAHKFHGMSLLDYCREAVRIDATRGVNMHDRDEVIRAAVSGSSLANIFGTNINARLMLGFVDAPDSTAGWVAEEDVNNFQTQDRNAIGKTGQLKKLARGDTAEHADVTDLKESYKIARYAEKWVVDDQDIVDDRFGGVDGVIPEDMGAAARQLRPDLAYSLILANPTLSQDSLAVFHATHANIDTNAFSEANLQIGITKMMKQRERGRPLNINARFLLVPPDLDFSADISLTSGERRTDETGAVTGTKNPLRARGITLRADERLGAAGVTDPDSGTAYTGSATNWFLFGEPRDRTIVLGFLTGTARSPQMRSGAFQPGSGQWGLSWDIKYDIGGGWLGYRGAYKGNS